MTDRVTVRDGKLPCNCCGRLKPVDDFPVDMARFSGRRRTCRACGAARAREWRQDNPGYRRGEAEWRIALPSRKDC